MLPLDEMRAAQRAVSSYVRRTPLVESPELGELLGCRVSLKLELFQATGSFKPRGTFNQALGLTDSQREAGVVAFSGGNFARAVGYAGGVLGLDTVVVMPQAAPASSVAATRRYGATVEVTPTVAAMIERTAELEAEGRTALHPFDHPRMVAGNASLGLELLEEAPDASHVIVSIGGGGFITGVGSALLAAAPGITLIGVETDGAAAMHDSLDAGRVLPYTPTSLASTLNAPYVSEQALAFAQQHVREVVLVSDRQAFSALETLADTAKIVPELAAAAPLAAARELSWSAENHVVLVVCGGNVTLSEIEALRTQLG